jgi:hypothetical protein
MSQRGVINDPQMRAMLDQYNEFAVNGATQTNVIQGKRVPLPARIRPIPRNGAAPADAAVVQPGGAQPGPALINPTGPRNTGGRLKSIGG